MALKRHAPEASYDTLYEEDRGHDHGFGPAGGHQPPPAPYADYAPYDGSRNQEFGFGSGPDGYPAPTAQTAPSGDAYGNFGAAYGGYEQSGYDQGAYDPGAHGRAAYDHQGGCGGYDDAYGRDAYAPAEQLATCDTSTLAAVPQDAYGPCEVQSPEPYEPCPAYPPQPGDEAGEPHFSPSTAAFGPEQDGPFDEWNPTEDSIRPVRGRHRVAKQRGGMARSGAVLGVGVIAAVGAGGMASAKDKSPTAISVPDLGSLATSVADELPAAADLPGIGDMVSGGDSGDDAVAGGAPLTQAGFSADDGTGQTDAGEALRARILAQAAQQQSEADQTARQEAAEAAAKEAAEKAAAQAEQEREAAAERKRKAAEEARRKAEQERLEKLARSFSMPLSSYTLSSSYGESGGMWENNHTGQDFSAPTGTPVKAVHSGTVKEAGWAGSYGYRIVLELPDGTEVWYCHLSSMNVSAGAEVTTKDVIGNVGSTGNSTGPHLHLEVRPGGGDPVDPLAWLRGKGLSV